MFACAQIDVYALVILQIVHGVLLMNPARGSEMIYSLYVFAFEAVILSLALTIRFARSWCALCIRDALLRLLCLLHLGPAHAQAPCTPRIPVNREVRLSTCAHKAVRESVQVVQLLPTGCSMLVAQPPRQASTTEHRVALHDLAQASGQKGRNCCR